MLTGFATLATASLPFWTAPRPDCNKPLCGYAPLRNTSSAPVYFGSADGGWYNHAAMLTIHRDGGGDGGGGGGGGDFVFTASWKNAPVSEDTPGQRVLYAQSADGLRWGPARVLFPNMSTAASPVAQFAGPFATIGGRLYATATPALISAGDAQGAQWCLWPDGQDPRNCATPDRPGTQPSGILIMRRLLPGSAGQQLGPIFWVGPDGPLPDVYAAAARANGVLPLSAVDAQTRADVATLTDTPRREQLPCDAADGTPKCEGCVGGCQLYEKLPHIGLANERSHWELPDGSGDVIVYRSHSKALFAAARPLDGGEAKQSDWPANVTLTDIPNDDSNINAGPLGAGRGVYIVANGAPNKVRDPLTLAIARDGRNFSSCRVVQTCTALLHNSTCVARAPHNGNVGPSYPQALSVVDPAPPAVQGLYVIATNNKEDVVITKVPWSAL